MKEHQKITEEDIAQARVMLRPIAGIQPRVYVSAAAALLCLFILFLILVYPGLRDPSVMMKFKGSPQGAGVFVDGLYAGNTTDGLRIVPGSHEIEIRKTGFSTFTSQVSVPRRIFGTLLVPPSMSMSYSLAPQSVDAVLKPAFEEFARWARTGKPSAVYQLPAVLSEAAADLAGSSADFSRQLRYSTARSLAAAALAVASNPVSVRDSIRASASIASPQASPLAYIALARSAIAAISRDGNGAIVLADITAGAQTGEDLYSIASRVSGERRALRPQPPATAGTVTVGPHRFVLFSGADTNFPVTTQEGFAAQVHVSVPLFGMAVTEVTNRQFALFLESNPSWKPDRRAELIARGLADEGYLAGFDPARLDDRPVTGVSWHAARAYCEWLAKSAPPGWEVVLPSEAEWAAAAAASAPHSEGLGVFSDISDTGPALVGSRGMDRAGLADMFGNVWEWTADGYRAYPWITDGSGYASELVDAIDSKVVRGGSWANKAEQIGLSSRGPVPASHASEFLGFRPALRKR